MRKDLDEQLEKALENVNEDRDVTKRLLNDLIDYISVSNDRHVEAGAIAAKYVETLQRSNEQVVKVAGIIQRAAAQSGPEGLSNEEKEDLFQLIQGAE
jgi:ABC-type transporter Mla subunit MlaD